MARILADENFDIEIVNWLRSLKHDVVCARDYSVSPSGDGTSDEQILRIAIQENRIVVTFNKKHFKALHEDRATIGKHKGIIACSDPESLTARGFASAIDTAIEDRLKINKHFYQQFILLNSKGEAVLRKRARTQRPSSRKQPKSPRS